MPKYIVNGTTYNIPDDKVDGFERAYPNAAVEYHNEGTTYQIPLSKRNGFLKQFPNASYETSSSFTKKIRERELQAEIMNAADATSRDAAIGEYKAFQGEDAQPAKATTETPLSDGWDAKDLAVDMQKMRSSVSGFDRRTKAVGTQLKNLQENFSKGGWIDGGTVTESSPEFNPETKNVEQTYISPLGNKYTDKVLAEQEARQLREVNDFSITGRIRKAHNRLKEVNEKLAKIHKETSDRMTPQGSGFGAMLGRALQGAESPGGLANAVEAELASNPEYKALQLTSDQLREQITLLGNAHKKELEGEGFGDFWRVAGQEIADIKAWDFGISNILFADTKLRLNEKLASGKPLSEAEQGAMKEIAEYEEIQQQYGDLGAWARYGEIGGAMLPFMVDIGVGAAAFGSVNLFNKGASKLATKAIGKEAAEAIAEQGVKKYIKANGLKGFGRVASDWSIKALGTGADELLLQAPLAVNTVQVGKTASDIIDRKLGNVKVDEDGTYSFSNDKTWGDAVWQGEANAIIEYYSEQLGSHLPSLSAKGLSSVADVVGAKRLSNLFLRVDASALTGMVKKINDVYAKLGVNGVIGEVMEEYAGQGMRTIANLDDAYQPLFDEQGNPVFKKDEHGNLILDENGEPIQERTNLFASGQFHGDIWGGMGLTMGLMKGVNLSFSAAGYASAKHGMHRASKRASVLFGRRNIMFEEDEEITVPNSWDAMRELIDMTTNEDMGALAESIMRDKGMNEKEKSAVMNYIAKSMEFRGFNLGSVAYSRMTSEVRNGAMYGEMASEIDKTGWLNQSWAAGYHTTDAEGMEDIRHLLMHREQQLFEVLGYDKAKEVLGDPEEALSRMSATPEAVEANRAISNYITALYEHNGMRQRIQDDIDTEVEEHKALADMRTNPDTGTIQSATMKQDNRYVYVVKGSVVPTPDGTSIDTEASDASIIVMDAVSGETEMVSADALLYANIPESSEEVKAGVEEYIQYREHATANKKLGFIDFSIGDEYNILTPEGETRRVTIVGPVDEEGNAIESEDGTVVVRYAGEEEPVSVRKLEIDMQSRAFAKARMLSRLGEERKSIGNSSNSHNSGFSEEEDIQQSQKPSDEEEQADTAEAASTPDFNVGTRVTLHDDSGNEIEAEIEDYDEDDGSVVVDVNFPINGSYSPRLTREEFLSMLQGGHQSRAEEEKKRSDADTTLFDQRVSDEMNGTLVSSDIATDNKVNQNISENGNNGAEIISEKVSAMQRIPKDMQGNPIYEQADSDTAWDAIVEQTEGDEAMAQTVADGMVADKEAALKKLEKAKSKGGVSIAEKIAAEKERKSAIDAAKAELDIWKKIAGTANRRKMEADAERRRIAEEAAALRKAEEEKLRAEREEAERIEREALNGVPDMVDDTPQDARARGYRRVSGHKIDRQEPLQALQGKEVSVRFSDDAIANGRVAVIDATQLQPSHVQGVRNPFHFIDEAQPKERNDEASVMSARKIAGNIRPEEITSSVTAYTGAPTVNTRGEAIQGNSRSDALRVMWESHKDQAEQYKQYLKDHADEFGLRAEDIDAMEHPVLVNMLDVEDAEAINLGQYVAQDTESGGTERIKPKNVMQKMGNDMHLFANLLLASSDEEISFAGLLDKNGVVVLKWMNQKGYITPTQYKSAFDSKGNLTAEAKNDLRGIMYQSVFKSGSTQLEEMFNALPAKAQKAILATAFRDYDSPKVERMIEEIQNSIHAYYTLSQDKSFAEAKTYLDAYLAANGWSRQYQIDYATGEGYLPTERFSNFALLLATMYKGKTQSYIQGIFNNLYDLIQGTQEENLFEQPDNTPRSLAEAIKEVLNIDYNGQYRSNVLGSNTPSSQSGRRGSTRYPESGERIEDGDRTADSAGGIDGDSLSRGSGTGVQETSEEVEALSETEIKELMSRMEDNASPIPQIELNPTNWRDQFGDNGMVRTPQGLVKMGANQIEKLFEKGRSEQFGMIKPTLETPQIIVEVPSEAADGNSERDSSLLFVKTFLGKNGEKVYYFKSVTVKKDGLEVSISSHYDRPKRVKDALKKGKLLYRFDGGAQTEHHPADVSVTASPEDVQGNGKLVWKHADDVSTASDVADGLYSPQGNLSDPTTEGTDAPQTNISDSKVTTNSPNANELGEKVAEAEAEVNTNPTEKQKEARLSEIKAQIEELHKQKEEAHSRSDIFEEARIIAESNELFAEQRKSEAEIAEQQEAPTLSQESEQVSDQDTAPYTIAPAQYTTKRGKVLDMFLVKFSENLTKEQQQAAKELAKADKGWYDREQGGFMMRSEDSAKQLAETIANDEDAGDSGYSSDSANSNPSGNRLVSDEGEVKKEKPQQNQSASSQKDGQDLTTGYSIDNDAETATKVTINPYGAKHELNKLIHKYAGQRKTRGFISDLASALGDMSSAPKQTYYFEFRDKSGNPYTLRISNHNVNANNVNEDEKEISIVVKSRRQPNKFIPGTAEVKEYVYFKESIANGDGQTLAWIVQDISSMLDTGVYADNSGVAIINTSPVEQEVKKVRAPKEREKAEGKKLRKATQEDLEKNPDVYYNGERHRILMLIHRGEQARSGQFTKPLIERVYLENMQDVKVEDLYVEDSQADNVAIAKEAVDFYKTNFKRNANISVIDSSKELYDSLIALGLSEDVAEEFVENVESQEIPGYYHPNLDKIFIFAWNEANPYLTLFHESVHKAVTDIGGISKFEALLEELNNLDPKLFKTINKRYTTNKEDELIAYSLEAALAGNAMDALRDYLSTAAKHQLDRILEETGYDRRRNSETDAERFVTNGTASEFRHARGRTRRRIFESLGKSNESGKQFTHANEKASESMGGSRQETTGERGGRRRAVLGGQTIDVGNSNEGHARTPVLEKNETRGERPGSENHELLQGLHGSTRGNGKRGTEQVTEQQADLFGGLYNNETNNEDGRARRKDTQTDNSGTRTRSETLSKTEPVGTGTSVSSASEDSRSKRRRFDLGSSESGNRPQYDVNKTYTNEEIGEIVSSVTEIVDGKVVITGVITNDIKAVCRQYRSGGVAKTGRGILDEYYTDGKIVDAVSMLISPYFKGTKAVRVLEPSVGVGNFIAATKNIPTSEVVTFEINDTTARISKVLYPEIDVNLRSFETEFIDESGNKKPMPKKFSLVIGNPPYGSHRGLYKGLGEESKIARYEDYFVKRSLDVLEEGGVLAMVLPSSWIDRHTKFGGYTIDAAYRLPSGAFEATQVGTDIVVLRKDSSIPVNEHLPYFEQHPERVLGEVRQRKGRFGKMENYVDGNIDTAIETIEREHAKLLAEQLNIEQSNDNLNDIQSAIEETGSAEKAKAIVESEKSSKEESVKKSDAKTEDKPSKHKVELSRGVETVRTSEQFEHKFSDGEVEAFADTEYDGTINNPSRHSKYANYIDGKAVHDFYYAEGDIYAKLAQLEKDKDYIVETYGMEQYEKQKQLLDSVLPKRKRLDEITISPNTTFVKELNIITAGDTTPLAKMFIDFCRKLPYSAFGNSSLWEVIAYVNNEQVYGQDKERNQLIRERRKRVANDLFAKFLNEELSDNAKSQVETAFNREYNSTYRPDYSKVPMFSTINKDFRGKPLKLTEVQLAGIGRMTVKGVGVLAHEVGFGKTLSGILAMHEAMTRGFASKPLIVVPNDNILKQWVETINEVLPSATVNVLGNLGTSYNLSDFKINDGEFTIVTYEGLKAMSFSDDTYNRLADRFSYITEDLKKHQSERDIQKKIEKRKELKGKMMRDAKKSYGFEDFGFDWLTFDEVHNANHIVSKVRLDKSVSSDFRSQSQRTSDLGLKTWLAAQYIQELNNGRNVLLLSATPFTNKPLEYYSILSLVANDMLRKKGFFNVDQFFATFMEADNELEVGANGRPVQKTNIRRFRNNGLFQQLLSEFIDIKGEEDNPDLVRPTRHNREFKIAQNELTEEAIAATQDLLNDNDTVLQGISHARAAAFSPYATSLLGIKPKNAREFVKNSPKIDAAIKLIEQNKKDRPDAGQIIYSEVGVEFFSIIRDYLVNESGFKANEVRIITGATSNSERIKIQSAFNKGEVKVVIGSPAIKEGLNLQENTSDMYILSLPWNFTQLRQIEGRGWRQGNKWENIRINYLLTNDSVDVFMLQRLQLKQGLYNEAMKSGAESLDVSDIDTSELKTVLITDPSVRAEIVTMQEKAKLRQEQTQIEADLSFVTRKYEAYNKLKKEFDDTKTRIQQYQSYAKDGKFWVDAVKREEAALSKISEDIQQEKENLLKKGVNVDEIERQVQQAQEAIEVIQNKIDNLEEYQKELTEKYRREAEAKADKQNYKISNYIKERKAENNNGFYRLRPKEDKQQTTEEDDVLYRMAQTEGVAEGENGYNIAEEQDIIDRATADGSYMKAPNGKPTKLNPKQWVQVRTKAFKKWFGDWEKAARIEKLKKSNPVKVEFNNEYELNRDNAKQWMKNNLRGEYTNIDTGESITISKVGINEVTSHGSQDNAHLISLKAVPQFIENSVFIEEIPNTKNHEKYDSYRYYVCGARINGEDYTVKVVIGVKGDSKFYDHRLTQIEKGTLIDNLNGLSNSVVEKQNTSLTSKDSKLVSILQTNASKVVDENGEPMVVYRGSPQEMGSIFEYGRNFYGGNKGFWFTTAESAAKDYSFNSDTGYYGEVKAVFLNIRNMMDLTPLKRTVTSKQFCDFIKQNFSIDLGRGSSKEWQTNELYEKYQNILYPGAHNGIKLVDVGHTYIAKTPSQIKSATENTGAFSEENDDIRSREGEGALSDREVTMASDPRSKVYGKPIYGEGKRMRDYAARQRVYMVNRVRELVERLHLDNVEIVTDASALTGEKQRAKGFYSPTTGKITIVIPNHATSADAAATLLHEAVAHYGLRQLFGEHFDTFLDNVFNNAEEDVRRRIATLATQKYKFDFRKATEEYLAMLAENTEFENTNASWWRQIKSLFWAMLERLGIRNAELRFKLSDNELRYILWMSYRNLKDGALRSGVFAEAEEVAKRYELGIEQRVVAEESLNAGSDYIRDSNYSTDLERVNERFNKELDRFANEGMSSNEILHIGKPMGVLNSFMPQKNIILRQKVLTKALKKHGLSVGHIKNLPSAISSPIFIFKNSPTTISMLTELQTDEGKNVFVAIELDTTKQLGHQFMEVNDVLTIHGRELENIILPIVENNSLIWVNKAKGQHWLSSAKSNSQAITNEALYSATKIVENFENPIISQDNNADLERVNERFNEELQQQIDGTLPKGHIYQMGMPSSILLSAGLPNLPIELAASRLSDKSMQENHPFDLSEVKGLVEGVQKPLAVFRSATHIGSFVVLTEIQHKGKNYVVAIEANRKQGRIEVNSVRSVHYRNSNSHIANWIQEGLLEYADKKRMSEWFSKQQYNSADVRNLFRHSAKIVENFENPIISQDNNAENDDDVLFRDGDPEIHQRALARDRYEQRVKSGMFQSQEALQDSMLGLKEAMTAILGKSTYIEDIAGFENAYLGENRLSSVNKAEADAFAHTLFKPMLDEVAKLARTKAEREELTDYMMAKHGLERNVYMRNEAIKNGADVAKALLTDYAGLTSLTGMGNVADAEAEARRMVEEYEQAHDTDTLWEKVNAVSKAILQKSYDCGLMSKAVFDKVSSMYDFYIPLRGFDEKTSADAYAYLTHKESAFNAPIKKAEGRKSKADDPFAYLQSMAESVIMQGNRNRLVKQRFLNFVLNHPSDLVSVSELWVAYDAINKEWRPVFPDHIDKADTPEEVEKKLQDFETKMEQLAQQYPDQYKRGKDAANIPYRVVESRDMRQHQVVVKRGGRDYVITINGNPRAAQALNGQTNPDNDMSGAIGAILRAGEKINRQLSAFYTTRNPDFVVSNFMRDMLYTMVLVWVKESPKYALRFYRNCGKVNPVKMKRLLAKYRKGTLDMSDKTEAMFHQFMMNGGETGYANIRDIEQHKNDIRRELKRANGKLGIRKALSLLAERFDELNRAVENCARFAAFVTSREMGRSIDRAIYDAKEISVNFNKKGSGAKFYDSTGQTKAGNASALVSGLGRSGYVFWNAAIQGTTNFGRQFKRHPAKAITAGAVMFTLGAIVAYMGSDDDDDKNAYYNLPEYVRRSNIMFRAGDSWISIPLPIEYRAFYGMGELMTSIISGKEHLTGGEIAEAILSQATQILPIDFMEGSGGWNAFVPSASKPFVEAYVTEKSWTGMPLYKDTPYNEDMPEWTKAYKSANKHIVNLAATLNDATGGDKYTKGVIDLNPAKLEYMLNGYFGGYSSTIDKLVKMGETWFGDREYDPRSFLLVNRLVKAGDERTEYRAVNNEYFRLKEEHDRLKTRLRHYEEDTDNGVFDYAEKIDFLYNSPEYERYEIFEDYRRDIDDLYDELKEAVDDKERKDIEVELNELKKAMIEEMNLTRK